MFLRSAKNAWKELTGPEMFIRALAVAITTSYLFVGYCIAFSPVFLGTPVQPVSDTFTGADSTQINEHAPDTGPGNAWTNAPDTWTISSNGAVNAPTEGAEVFNDTGFDTACGTSWTCGASWSIAGSLASFDDLSTTALTQTQSLSANIFYAWTFTVANSVGSSIFGLYSAGGGTVLVSNAIYADGSHTRYFKAPAGVVNLGVWGSDTGAAFDLSATSLKPIATADLFALSNTGHSSGYVKLTNTTIAEGSILGPAMCVDDPSNPQNGFVAVVDRTSGNGRVWALNSGTWTSLINTSVTYAANAEIHLLLDENKKYLYFWYNNALVDTRKDVSSYSTIINNPYHGVFGVGATGDTVDSVDIQPLQFGEELIVNGGFGSAATWDAGVTSWTISGGVATATAETGAIFQEILHTQGELYYGKFDLVSQTGGTVRIEAGAAGFITFAGIQSAPGTYTGYYICADVSGNKRVQLDGVTAFSGSCDNVSIKQVN